MKFTRRILLGLAAALTANRLIARPAFTCPHQGSVMWNRTAQCIALPRCGDPCLPPARLAR